MTDQCFQVEKQIQSITGLGAHAVVVSVGNEAGYNLGVKLLRPLGTLVCVGIPPVDFHIPISPLDCLNRGITSPFLFPFDY